MVLSWNAKVTAGPTANVEGVIATLVFLHDFADSCDDDIGLWGVINARTDARHEDSGVGVPAHQVIRDGFMGQGNFLPLGQNGLGQFLIVGDQGFDLNVIPDRVDPVEVGQRVDPNDLGDLPQIFGQIPDQVARVHIKHPRGAVNHDDDGIVVAELPFKRVELLEHGVVFKEERRVGEVRYELGTTEPQGKDQQGPEDKGNDGSVDDELNQTRGLLGSDMMGS